MKCQNCKKHKGTMNWVGEGSFMDFNHGNYQKWCKCCCLKAMIVHAKKISKQIVILENEYINTKCL